MNVFITGLNGFIARHLAAWFSERGYVVTGTSRSGSERFRTMAWRMGDPIEGAALARVDVVMHAAHDFTPGAMNTNIRGTLAMERAAAGAGVRRQILVSSLSARPDAVSEYGRTKLALEEYFIRNNHTIVRPGTVLGKGGLFGKIAGMMKSLPVLPLLDGGHARMTVIGVHDLCRALEAILQIHEAKQYNLYYEEMPTFGELLRQLGTILNRNVLFVPVPAAFLLLPLSVLRYLRIRPPIDVDNLKGYITNLAPYHPTNLSSVLARHSTLQAVLEEAWGRRNTGDRYPFHNSHLPAEEHKKKI
jgi:nucleoside-diphosphate-sugar epimerase